MGVLDLLAVIIICVTVIIVIVGYTTTKYNTVELEEENKKLKEKVRRCEIKIKEFRRCTKK